MRTSDLFRETQAALTANKVRTGLTMLGVVIGTASVIAMVAIGNGASTSITASIEGLGSNLLTIFPGVIQPGRGIVSSGRGTAQTLKLADAEALGAIDGIANVSKEFQIRAQVIAGPNNTNTNIIGSTEVWASVHNGNVINGDFFGARDVEGSSHVAVLGDSAAKDLFPDSDPIGQKIRIRNIQCTVVGVLASKGGGFGNPDDQIIIPLGVAMKQIAGADWLTNIVISVQNKDEMDRVKSDVTSLLASRHRVSVDAPDFSILSQADILKTLSAVTSTFTAFLGAVAGISLVVGGIGIMNMMLTTVTERTREIGLRMALGARRRDIAEQFLFEALLLTFIGGIAGVLLGSGISFAVSVLAGIASTVTPGSVILAFGVASGIGLVFGYYPARKASRMEPIDALRYE